MKLARNKQRGIPRLGSPEGYGPVEFRIGCEQSEMLNGRLGFGSAGPLML
jgi:hypothetical protein